MHIILHLSLSPSALHEDTDTDTDTALDTCVCVCVCNEKKPLFAYLFGTFAVTISNSFGSLNEQLEQFVS